jgi:hypothetical protein
MTSNKPPIAAYVALLFLIFLIAFLCLAFREEQPKSISSTVTFININSLKPPAMTPLLCEVWMYDSSEPIPMHLYYISGMFFTAQNAENLPLPAVTYDRLEWAVIPFAWSKEIKP